MLWLSVRLEEQRRVGYPVHVMSCQPATCRCVQVCWPTACYYRLALWMAKQAKINQGRAATIRHRKLPATQFASVVPRVCACQFINIECNVGYRSHPHLPFSFCLTGNGAFCQRAPGFSNRHTTANTLAVGLAPAHFTRQGSPSSGAGS